MSDRINASAVIEICTWCGVTVQGGEGYRLAEPAGERRAAFCRLEHVVPWAIQGARWEAGQIPEPAALAQALEQCARCGVGLSDTYVPLVRHRGQNRVPDAFCSVDHLDEWARSGGRWG